MSEERPAGGEVLSRWLGESAGTGASMPTAAPENPPSPRSRSWRRVLRPVVLLVPWVATLALLAAQGPDSGASARRPSAAETAVTDRGNPLAEATAVRLVRDAVTAQHDERSTALDVAAAEPAHPLGADAWLVRVQAVVLQGDRRRWHSAAHQIWAVPVSTADGRAVGLELPWRVSNVPNTVAATTWQTATIAAGPVHAALRKAGLRPADGVEIQQHPRLAGILRARVVTDGVTGHVWLHAGPPPQVLGASTRSAPRVRAPFQGAP